MITSEGLVGIRFIQVSMYVEITARKLHILLEFTSGKRVCSPNYQKQRGDIHVLWVSSEVALSLQFFSPLVLNFLNPPIKSTQVALTHT